jgi:hypothetical protein
LACRARAIPSAPSGTSSTIDDPAADVRALADAHRRDELRVAADEAPSSMTVWCFLSPS